MKIIIISEPLAFAKKIDALSRKNLSFLTFKDKPSGTKDAMLIFDFAWKDIFTLLPALKEKNIKANIIVSVDTIGKYNFYDDPQKLPWRDMLTLEQIKTLIHAGWGIATYGLGYKKEDLEFEKEEAIFRLKNMGLETDIFITPFKNIKNEIK